MTTLQLIEQSNMKRISEYVFWKKDKHPRRLGKAPVIACWLDSVLIVETAEQRPMTQGSRGLNIDEAD